jgi:hypothetical protein
LPDDVNEFSVDAQWQLKEKCKELTTYSIAVDENAGTRGQLAVFIRGVNDDLQIVEELTELVPVTGETHADEVFSELATL